MKPSLMLASSTAPPPARRRLRRLTALALLVVALGAGLAAQRGFRGFRGPRVRIEPNVPYDGRFTFARVRYTVYGRSGWEFDYPTMERHLMTMVNEITALHPHMAGSNIHAFDDPELLKFPVAYLSEPGYWIPSDAEAEGLRTYLKKGGFLIVDDFMRDEWYNFEASMRKALPDAVIAPLPLSHPVFHSFFDIQTLDMDYPNNPYIKAEFLGIHEDNDPAKRLMVVINYNNDIGDYMEWSEAGYWPVNISNEAYKFAINYLMYGLTH
ncbi:MAG: DUF4159 domain-containing protein [Vicinamibacterales bacterium]